MSKHAYIAGCDCMRCVREALRRAAQSAISAPKLRTPKRAALKRAARYTDPLDQGDNLGNRMTSKHTPGPWHLIDKGDGFFPSVLIGQFGIPYSDGSGNYDHCGQITVNGAAPGGPHEMHVVNARLIAAALDMAEALREIVENAPGSRRPDWLEMARAAIAKAGL